MMSAFEYMQTHKILKNSDYLYTAVDTYPCRVEEQPGTPPIKPELDINALGVVQTSNRKEVP